MSHDRGQRLVRPEIEDGERRKAAEQDRFQMAFAMLRPARRQAAAR